MRRALFLSLVSFLVISCGQFDDQFHYPLAVQESDGVEEEPVSGVPPQQEEVEVAFGSVEPSHPDEVSGLQEWRYEEMLASELRVVELRQYDLCFRESCFSMRYDVSTGVLQNEGGESAELSLSEREEVWQVLSGQVFLERVMGQWGCPDLSKLPMIESVEDWKLRVELGGRGQWYEQVLGACVVSGDPQSVQIVEIFEALAEAHDL